MYRARCVQAVWEGPISAQQCMRSGWDANGDVDSEAKEWIGGRGQAHTGKDLPNIC